MAGSATNLEQAFASARKSQQKPKDRTIIAPFIAAIIHLGNGIVVD